MGRQGSSVTNTINFKSILLQYSPMVYTPDETLIYTRDWSTKQHACITFYTTDLMLRYLSDRFAICCTTPTTRCDFTAEIMKAREKSKFFVRTLACSNIRRACKPVLVTTVF